jgi:hypothetical protein
VPHRLRADEIPLTAAEVSRLPDHHDPLIELAQLNAEPPQLSTVLA